MSYPTDLTDKHWAKISDLIEDDRKRKYKLRAIFLNAIFYLLKTGCQWPMLPED